MIASCSNPIAERPNEDRALIAPLDAGRVLLCVADGAGGHPDGALAATIAIETVTEALRNRTTPLRHAIMDAFERANGRIIELGSGAATTLLAVVIDGGRLRSVHVGDSMAAVVGGKGRVHFRSVAHSPVGYAEEAGLLAAEDAMHHDERHLVSNLLGHRDMHVQIQAPLRLRKRDTIVVGSDGLFDNMEMSEIADVVRKGSLLSAAQHLLAECRRRMVDPRDGEPSKPDDTSFLLFRARRESAPQ